MGLMDAVRNASCVTQSVNVGVSLGKDSVCMLDLCCKNFKNVHAFFMYFCKGLKFQEDYIKYLEDRYQIEIMRIPHWMLGTCYAGGLYRDTNFLTDTCQNITIKDVELYISSITGTDWFCYGMMMCESIERNAMIKASGVIDEVHHVIYPLAEWSPAKVKQYLLNNNIRLSPEYRYAKRSIGDLRPENMEIVKEHFPDDYETIKRIFPYIEAHEHRRRYAEERRRAENRKTAE